MALPDARDNNREVVEDLNVVIDRFLDVFIAEENSEKRNDAWKVLQETARKYLCLVPQNQKFKFNETERVLLESANSREDFDPREACRAFECLTKYAHNLLQQPWRQEFHTIQLTSGFYVHNVAAHLKNAHEILIAMGYVNISDKSLKLVPNYEVSTIKAVSKDCVLACQECIILSDIWEKVSFEEPNYPFTTDKIYEFRNKHKGDVEATCKIILEDVRSKQKESIPKETRKMSSFLSDAIIKDNRRESLDKCNNSLIDNSRNDGEGHFYDAVSPGEFSSMMFSSPTSRRSKSMTFSTSTPKERSFNQSRLSSEKYFTAEINLDEDMLDGSLLSPRNNSDGEHVYSNVPSHREKNTSKSFLNREKTKWHTPMKYKLQPQGHLRFSKLNERELSYLMKENDVDDLKTKVESKKVNRNVDSKKLEVYDSTTFPRVRESVNNAANANKGDSVTTVLSKVVTPNESLGFAKKRYASGGDDIAPRSVIPTEQRKSSNSESSYLNIDLNSSNNDGSTASSTDVSSWDMKAKEEKKSIDNAGGGDHHYDDVPFEKGVKSVFRQDPCSRNSFGLCRNDDTVYYDSPNDSNIGFGFGESPNNSSRNQKVPRDNNTTFFTCDESFKSLVEEEQVSSNVNKEPKLDDLEDVWFHTLLKKEEFNYLDPRCNETFSEYEYFPEQKQERALPASKSKSSHKYFQTVSEESCADFDRRLEYESQPDYRKPSTSALSKFNKLDDSVINANLHQKVNKVTQTSKGTIQSYDLSFKPKGIKSDLEQRDQKFIPFDSWDCKHCTFINTENEYICEICSKSKDYAEDHDVIEGVESLLPKLYSLPEYIKEENILGDDSVIPPKISRKTCPQCTLINAPSARICDACGFRLKEFNSPSKSTWLEDMYG